LSILNLFPCDTIGRTVFDGLVYLSFWVVGKLHYVNIAGVISSEDRGAEIQTGLTVRALAQINDGNLHAPLLLLPEVYPSIPCPQMGRPIAVYLRSIFDEIVRSPQTAFLVIPAKAGIQ
jgi:hypothetical protein